MRYPLLARIAIIAGLAVALLVPLKSIELKVSERRERAQEVRKRFAAETSGAQVLGGPFIALTCEETYVDERTEGKKTVKEWRKRACNSWAVAPSRLDLRGQLPIEERRRGIYPIHLYRAKLQLAGEFGPPPPPPSANGSSTYRWKEAFLVLGISDVRGVKNVPALRLDGKPRELEPGALNFGITSGLHLPLGAAATLPGALGFELDLELEGMGRIAIAPVGDRTSIRLSSSWPHPSFSGAYSPEARDISDAGFSAAWNVSDFATGGGAYWAGSVITAQLFNDPALLGVSFVEPVNVYSLSYRAVEYGFLFVLLTFAALGMVEALWDARVHPVQYGFTGLALAVFFLLLIALSEHLAFALSYALASAACVAILTYYLHAALGAIARTGAFAGMFAALYGALYVLLRSEDHSLLLGALLVFGVLAAAMLLTRRIDWSEFSARIARRAASQAA